MSVSLPQIPALTVIANRLPSIFPEGTPERNYCIREMAAKTVWVMVYVGAIEGSENWIRPSMVTDMSDVQAPLTSDAQRTDWYKTMRSSNKKRPVDSWYAPNSREPIRDETLRGGLVNVGAVIQRTGVPITSSHGIYALAKDFAALFDSKLTGKKLATAIENWQAAHLTPAARARITLIKKGFSASAKGVQVLFPNGSARVLSAGPSSVLSKAVVEEFAHRYLTNPAVLWLSESASKVQEQDVVIANALGLKINPAKELPDIILVDLGAPGSKVLVVFVEVVATDGPINEKRKAALLQIAGSAKFDPQEIAFLSVFADRSAPAFKRAVASLALGSFTWFMSEPDSLMILRDGKPVALSALR